MLISKYVEIKATGQLVKKYNCKYLDIIKVPIESLSIGTHAIVKVQCDYCNTQCLVEYRVYIKQTKIIDKFTCKNKNCVSSKLKEVNIEKYGVDNLFRLESTKEKIKKTNLERYGVENAGWSIESQEKIKKTNLEKYGVETPFQSEEIKEKIKQTNIKKYGFENPFQSEEIKEKIKYTNLDKYGTEYANQSEEIKDKIRQTNLEKYGFEQAAKSDIVKKNAVNNNLKKYGVISPTQLDSVKIKMKSTNLMRYGAENYSQSDDYTHKYKSSLSIKQYKDHHYQSRYELDFLIFCDKNNISLSQIVPTISYKLKDKSHVYYPDFFYEKCNLIIEIKSTYWYNKHKEMNIEKENQTRLNGYNYIIIMDKDYYEFMLYLH